MIALKLKSYRLQQCSEKSQKACPIFEEGTRKMFNKCFVYKGHVKANNKYKFQKILDINSQFTIEEVPKIYSNIPNI